MAEQEIYKTGQEDILYRIEVENPFKVLGFYIQSNETINQEGSRISFASGKSLEEEV